MSSKPCEVCTKTVYPLEAVVAAERTYHKGCFKCQDADCGIQLTLKTAEPHVSTGKVYCNKHYPKEKATAVANSLAMENAKNSPKVATVNTNKRGDGMETNQMGNDSMQIQNSKNAPKVATVNTNKRGDDMENPNVTVDSLQVQNAKKSHQNAQALHNDQVRGESVPTSTIGLAMNNQINAPKADTVNQQVRGESVPTSTIGLTMNNQINAPKADTVNQQVRGESEYSSVIDKKMETAMNAPKADVVNQQIRGEGEFTPVIDKTMETALNAPKAAEPANPQIRSTSEHSYNQR